MSQWSTLTRFQRVLLIALTALLAVFTVVYPVLSRRKGIQYRDALLLWSAQGENDVYAGRVDGARTVFTVASDGTIQYRRGDTDYGPYTVALDPSAVPRDSDMADVLTGVEVRDGADILFRGGWYNSSFPLLVDVYKRQAHVPERFGRPAPGGGGPAGAGQRQPHRDRRPLRGGLRADDSGPHFGREHRLAAGRDGPALNECQTAAGSCSPAAVFFRSTRARPAFSLVGRGEN